MSEQPFEVSVKRASHPLVLALDVGSTASRGSLHDASGRPIKPRAKLPHAFTTGPDGTSIIDPDQVVDEIVQIIDDLVEVAPNAPIAGVALDTFASSLLGVDADGKALTTCFNYNDNRCADEVPGLRADADEDEIQARTGARFHASYLPARLRWLRRTEPELFARVHRWVSLGEYIHLRLLGQAAAGTSTAAWAGLLNRRTSQWDALALDLSGITAEQLSPIAHPDQPITPLPGSIAASRWPELRDAAWFAPIGDGYAATRGVGTGQGGAVISLATSGAMRMMVPDPIGAEGIELPGGLWSYRVDAGHSLVGGAVNDVGRATAWLQRELNLPPDEEVERQLTEPPSHITPLVLPFLTGERSTGWQGSARATFQQVSYATSALEIYRGTLEGIVWTFQRIADQIATIAGPVTTARVGGRVLSEAPGLLTVMADGLTMELVPVEIKRSTLLGTARIALDVVAPGIERAEVETGTPRHADPAHAKFYDQRQLLLDELYASAVTGFAVRTGSAINPVG